jgi:Cys-rich protein (TIGR01571 family)
MNRSVHPVEAIPAHRVLTGALPGVSHGRWNDTVFSCHNQLYPSCVCSFLCPCVIAGQVSHKIQYRKFGNVVMTCSALILVVFMLSITTGSGLFFSFFWICLMYYAWHVRSIIRQQYDLPGGPVSDCYLTALCIPCVLAQVIGTFCPSILSI